MDAPELIAKLHNAARSYCIERNHFWARKYAELEAAERNRIAGSGGKWEYSAEAYNIFPRYDVLDTILRESEAFVPADFSSLDDARALLAAAGETPSSAFTRGPRNPTEIAAIADERRCYIQYILSVDLDQLRRIPDLPFRRALSEEEHKRLHQQFCSIWGEWYGGAVARKDLQPNATLHVAAMDAPNAYSHLRNVLIQRGLCRVLELREFDTGYELDTISARFSYTGAEGFWTSGDMSWMVYASHESSITFGGDWLIQSMRAALPDFDRWIYRGWDLTAYDS